MDPLTHSLVGFTSAKAGLERLSPYTTAACILSANAPDIGRRFLLLRWSLGFASTPSWDNAFSNRHPNPGRANSLVPFRRRVGHCQVAEAGAKNQISRPVGGVIDRRGNPPVNGLDE